MAKNNAINSPFPFSLAHGGTAADLSTSTSAGGIFYSTASTAAILANTGTTSCILLSGSSTLPTWSTATYPSTTTTNQLLYSSATNVISGLTPTAMSASLVTNSSQVPVWSGTMSNGQVIIGNATTGLPAAANLTAGTNISITNGAGTITVNSTAGSGSNWIKIATQTVSNVATLNFNNNLSSTYIAYRIVLMRIAPPSGSQLLYLRLGTGAGPTYVSTGYIYQIFDVNNNGGTLSYPGYTGTPFTQAQINNNNIFGGFDAISGFIDLFLTSGSSNVASGISHTSHYGGSFVYECNNTSTFQQPAANFTSVQLLMDAGNITGTAYLYGLTT